MVLTRQKARAGTHTESITRTYPEKIYVKYELPVGQFSHRKIMNYLFNKFFNTLVMWRVKICIVVFLV